MDGDIVKPRTMIVAFVGFALIAALAGIIIVSVSPGASTNNSTFHTPRPISRAGTVPKTPPIRAVGCQRAARLTGLRPSNQSAPCSPMATTLWPS